MDLLLTSQRMYLEGQARTQGARWREQARSRFAGIHYVYTAYSAYHVVDGRVSSCVRAPTTSPASPCDDSRGALLVGFLERADGPGRRIGWILHESPQPGCKVVFWHPSTQGAGRFVITSRLVTTSRTPWVAPSPPPNQPPAPTAPRAPWVTPSREVVPAAAEPAGLRRTPPAPPPPRCMRATRPPST